MLDYFAGPVGYDSSGLKLDMALIVKYGGEITSSQERWENAFAGSYEEKVRINRTVPTPDMLKAKIEHGLLCSTPCYYVSGEMIKVLQGHNVFGPSVSSLGRIIQDVMREIVEKEKRPLDVDSPLYPAIQRNRVDVTTSIRLDSNSQVNEWLTHAKNECRRKHGGVMKFSYEQRSLIGVPQVCFGLGSKRWCIVCYNKFEELVKHPPKGKTPEETKMKYDELREYAEGLLRIELRLFRLELKDRGTLDESIIWEYFDRIERGGVMKDDIGKDLSKLRPPVQNIYTLWREGHDVSPASGRIKRASFYNYRKEILDAGLGDISLSPPAKKKGSHGVREQFETDWLKSREVKEVPGGLKKYLYEPGDSPVWPVR